MTTTGYNKNMFEIKELTMPENIEVTYLVVRATHEPGMPFSVGPNGIKIKRDPHPGVGKEPGGRERRRRCKKGKKKPARNIFFTV